MEVLSLNQFRIYCDEHNVKSFLFELNSNQRYPNTLWIACRFDKIVVDVINNTIEFCGSNTTLKLAFIAGIELKNMVEDYYQKFSVRCSASNDEGVNKYELMMTFN